MYKAEEGKSVQHIIEKDCSDASFYVSKEKQTIYVMKHGILNQYDFNGNTQYAPIALPEDFQFYRANDNVLIGKNESIDTSKVIEYDVENDLQNIMIDAVKYDNDQSSFCVLESEILNYSFKSMLSRLIGVSDYQIAYMDKFYHPEIYIINYLNSTETKIELYNYIQNGYYIFGCLNDNTISAIVTDTPGFFFDKINVEGNTSTLKYHNHDSCIFIDWACGQKVGRKECIKQCTVTSNERKRSRHICKHSL